jgi:hypothetical protein
MYFERWLVILLKSNNNWVSYDTRSDVVVPCPSLMHGGARRPSLAEHGEVKSEVQGWERRSSWPLLRW